MRSKAIDAQVLGQDDETSPGFSALKIGNAQIFATIGWGANGHIPSNDFSTSVVSQYVYSDDVDTDTTRAVAAGATLVSEPTDMYWGERRSTTVDPFGHR